MTRISKILVPVDFSKNSRLAVDYALSFSDRFDAPIHLLHAWEVPAYLQLDLTVWSGELSMTMGDHVRKEAEKSMAALVEELGADGRKGVTSAVVFGVPYNAILSAAESGGYDLIVMGTHGRTGLPHLVLGSIAERVVRHAKCAVLTVRATGIET